jgi:hypothetical protein
METAKDPKRHSRLVFVFTEHLDVALLEEEEKAKPDHKTLLEQLDPEIGDDLLIALRKIFSLTYTDRFEIKDLDKVVSRIKSLAVRALKPFAPMLETLKQKPLKAKLTQEEMDEPKIHKYCLVRRSGHRFMTKDAETDDLAPLVKLIPTADADGVLIALRKILSETFSEMFEYRDLKRSLYEIRMLAATALVPLNEWLEEIELEPVAMPSRPFQEPEENEEEESEEPEEKPSKDSALKKGVPHAQRKRRN